MSERVKIIVQSSLGGDGPLTVRDALQQVLDFFELMEVAQGTDKESRAVTWRLAEISFASPLQATGEAISSDPAVAIDLVAKRAKTRVFDSFNQIIKKKTVPDWVDDHAERLIKSLLQRNTNGVGRTDFQIDPKAPLVTIVEKSARAGLVTLEQADLARIAAQADLTRTEYGSVEGDVIKTETYFRRPAIVIRERVTGKDVSCILSDDLAKTVGPLHNWSEVWSSQRVLVSGEIFYDKYGDISRVSVEEIIPIKPPNLTFSEISDSKFTSGLDIPDYLDKLREGEIG